MSGNQSNSATAGSVVSCSGTTTSACSTTLGGGSGGEDGEPPRCSLLDATATAPAVSTTGGVVAASIAELAPPARRHGRFLVQPITASPLQSSSLSSRSASPGSTALRTMSSPQPSSASVLSERRPSRIIGRFEVSELLPTVKSTNMVIQELSTASTSGDTTPLKNCGGQ